MQYSGFALNEYKEDSFYGTCSEGRICIQHKMHHNQSTCLCNNYSKNITNINKVKTFPIDLVSDSESLLVVVYSFKHYSEVSVLATITSTHCKGVYLSKLKKSKNLLLVMKWKLDHL